MKYEEIRLLLEKYNEGLCTEAEQQILDSAYLNWNENEPFILPAEMLKEDLLTNRQIVLQKFARSRRHSFNQRIAVAAALVLMFLGVTFFVNSNLIRIFSDSGNPADIAPGRTGATLTLTNGKKIAVAGRVSGELAEEHGVLISKDANGRVIYTLKNQHDMDATTLNVLETSKGEQSQLMLPDGSVVFLNAGSVLKFPSSFSKKGKRSVELSGEAFFDITSDKSHPFVVRTNNQEVEVLGTQFNVSGYPEDPLILTTLLEGSVKVSLNGGMPKMLTPGQQSAVKGDVLKVRAVETEYAVSWKNGYFMFNHESLGEIMQKISRWYNVGVAYEDDGLKKLKFFGSISKFEKVSQVLGIMERTNAVEFEINKKTIYVRKK